MLYIIGQNFAGQNFRRIKYFAGQKFRHQAEISPLMSGEIFCPAKFCPEFLIFLIFLNSCFFDVLDYGYKKHTLNKLIACEGVNSNFAFLEAKNCNFEALFYKENGNNN